MISMFALAKRRGKALFLAAVLVFSSLVAIAPEAYAATSSDNFARANGPLGANWTDMSDGGLTIVSQTAAGSSASNSGDMWTAQTFGSNQYSEVETTSVALTGGEWVGPSVRSQAAGASDYVGIYYWNWGSPELMLFLRSSGGWEQLGSSYNSGVLAAGTVLELMANGTTITFLENNVPRITATDSTLSGGAPGIMAYGTGAVTDWSGGDVPVGAPQSIGGTVSGLSGTVVLADNGVDQLSLSANGPFTFASQLPSGSQYAVTVQNNPTGQTCSVANGTGIVGSSGVTNVAVECAAQAQGSATDNFARANGPLGANWTDDTDGGLAISSDEVVGTNAGATTGDYRTAEAYNSNQYSEIQVTSTQLTGSEWIGAAVRVQDGGQEGYVGIYSWNNGSPELEIFNRNGSTWDQVGPTYDCGALPAGTTLKLMVVGSTLSFLENGVERAAGYDPTYTGGDPGIMIYGTGPAGNWSGGTAGFEVHYLSTDANGVQSYDMISANNGYGPQVLRVLNPTDPAPGVPHNFIYTLPVQPGADNTTYGDGLDTLESLNAQNQYNLTIIEPSFGIDPWYADNPLDANEQEETFMTTELVPWVTANLSITGTEQSWLIGFSKSGYGGMDLLLKHPNLFTLGAFWDFPADMSSYNELGSDPAASYGTDANFQANYRLTQAFVDSYKGPFLSNNRIWLGGYSLYETDVTDFDALLTAEDIPHTLGPMQDVAHAWTSGWVPAALAALASDGAALGTGTGTGGPSPQSISFTAPAGGTVGASATLSATGGASGNPVVFSVDASSGAGVCNVSGTNGTTVNYTAPGSCTVDANQAGNGSYTAAPQVQRTIPVTPVQSAPAITSAATAAGTVGSAFSFTVQSTGSPTPTLSRTGTLPAGVSFTAGTNGTATLSGTPTKAGSYTETLTAANGVAPNATQALVVTISQAPAITSAAHSTATVGTAFTFSIKTTGSPAPSISDGGAILPAGLSFTNSSNGTATLAGTPAAGTGGLYTLAITASNGVGQPATQSFALTVDQAPAITSAASTTATVGTAFSFTVRASGYPSPTFSRTGTLPAGVSFASNGNGTATFSGTPTKAGTYTETIAASNGVSPKATQSLVITVGH